MKIRILTSARLTVPRRPERSEVEGPAFSFSPFTRRAAVEGYTSATN
jgi:hypothetical protein